MARHYGGTLRNQVPDTPEGLIDYLGSGEGVAALKGKTKAEQAEVFRQYAKNFAARDGGEIEAQAREQAQLVLAEFMRANGGGTIPRAALGGGAGRSARSAAYNKAAPGAAIDGMFASMGEFLAAVSCEAGALKNLRGSRDLVETLGRVSDIQNSQSTDVPSDGGFLVPEEFRSDLLMLALEHGVIRPRATVIPMGSQALGIPTVDATSDATTLFGGIQMYWVDESTAPPETSAKFAQVKLDAKKLMGYFTAPSELPADAPAFNAFIDRALPQAIAFEEDYKFMTGSGVGEPLGFINCAASIIAAAVTGQGANTIIVDNLAAMFARMFPSSLNRAIWVADIGTFPQLALMAVQGSLANSTPVWMNNGVQDAPPISIYGRPVYFTEKCPALGTTGDITFLDPSFYLVGDRSTVQVSASEHFLFSSDKVAYKVLERVDGRPWINSPLTPRNSGATLSSFVQLSSTRT
jgi:HK97 family phage major capsid protein